MHKAMKALGIVGLSLCGFYGTARSDATISIDHETLTQSTNQKVDVLIIVDNSGSMSEEQAKIAAAAPVLLGSIHTLDYQVNVITTDSPCPVQADLPYTKDTPNLLDKLQVALRPGISGHFKERPLQMLLDHLAGTADCHISWLRPEAQLGVIFITDEDEDTSSTASDQLGDIQDYGYYLDQNIRLYGIFESPSLDCPTAIVAAAAIEALVIQSGGFGADICQSNYTFPLLKIGFDLVGF